MLINYNFIGFDSIARHDTILQLVWQNIKTARNKYKTRSSQKGHRFEVGDQVPCKNIRSPQCKGRKLEPNWTGPFIVVGLENKRADLKSSTLFFPKVKTDQFHIFKERQPRIPENITVKKEKITTVSVAFIHRRQEIRKRKLWTQQHNL